MLTQCAKITGSAISDFLDFNAQEKGLPLFAAEHPHYLWYLPYTKQKVFTCDVDLEAKAFIEIASDVLKEARCTTARLEYYQILETPDEVVTEKYHLAKGDLSGNTSGVKFQGSSTEILSAFDAILVAVRDLPQALFSISCAWRDHPVAEIQIEFTQQVDASAVFRNVIKCHPGFRMLGALIP